MHPACYDADNLRLSPTGIEYLMPIFNHAMGRDDLEEIGQLFHCGHLYEPYHSINVDVGKRIRYAES